ncbi:MAG TPA: peptidyl-tRNA hydrolase [Candidatus Diapherotrites archaeon]|uniref:Peptidyl-tRNA hydrolase n=1 Tax=Candidatus Iainarchaeum sp. TaxID=3101447 RepID=A0A7J4IV04_9ARCH|nr:peptidyl-tRNA hydrolase [Candidatus Diapherotrites archaeon]
MDFKQAMVVRSDLQMGKGKIAAQCSHASLEAYEKTLRQSPLWVGEWKAQGQAKIVLKVGSKKELLELFEKVKKAIPSALIKDAGHTQVDTGEPTCIGIGPAPEAEINRFTKDLKLL